MAKDESEVAGVLLRARLRRARRVRQWLVDRNNPVYFGRVTEADRLIGRLEERLDVVREDAAERYWMGVYQARLQ